MTLQTDEAVNVYRQLATVPLPTSARLANAPTTGHVVVHSVWEQRDLEKKEKVVYNRTHMVHLDLCLGLEPELISNISWCVESPSGQYCAILRNNDDDQFIEIWTSRNLRKTIKVGDIKEHGRIYGNEGQFGCFEWNHAETQLLYIAEKKQPKHKSFFDRVENEAASDLQNRGQEYDYQEHWGEQMTRCFHPVLCVLDIDSKDTRILDTVPPDMAPGRAIWGPEDLGVICVAWCEQPYRLGLMYSQNRRNSMYFIDLKTFTSQSLLPPDVAFSVRCPVLSPDQKKLVFLSTPRVGTLTKCSTLHTIDWTTKRLVLVVDKVNNAVGHDFPGIFTIRLPKRCWTSDSNNVLMSTFWRSKQELISVDITTGTVTRLTNDPAVGSWSLHDVHNGLILATCSSPCVCPYLVIGRYDDIKHRRPIQWTALDAIPQSSPHISYRYLHMDVPAARQHPQFPDVTYECILVYPTRAPSCAVPLIVYPHGGPHAVFFAEYSRYIAGFCLCGYAVLEINYRGSLGFGQDSIDSLLGRIGEQDVEDCQAAVAQVVAMTPQLVDPDAIVAIGGSHGGSLAAHLISRYPNFYKAAIVRNPVMNIAAMLTLTDVPDWCHLEVGSTFDFRCTSDPKDYEKMWNKSPIRHVDQVKTPVMLMVGQDDLRVPPSQAVEYMRALRARGATVQMKSYRANSHPLDKVEADADSFINIISFFNKYLPKHSPVQES